MKCGGAGSLGVSHSVRRTNASGFAAPRWYQVNVTGGTVAAAIPQATTWDPDGANVIHRWMPSVALDRAGNLAMGYSTSNATTEFPSIKYAPRLPGDPVNTFSQTEQTFFTGTPSQTGTNRRADLYPSMNASKPGLGSASASSIAVTDGSTTTQNFSLTAAPPSACITDTTQTDFQTGVPSASVDLNTSPGDVTLSNAPAVDQSNTAGTTTGTGFGTPHCCPHPPPPAPPHPLRPACPPPCRRALPHTPPP